jgi:hypothetical protein
MKHPYIGTPGYRRWRSAMTELPPSDIDPIVSAPWRISSTDRIATAGSCFAQHVAQRLQAAGMRFLITEPAHSILSAETASAFGFNLFSARFGSVYTSRQLLQLLRRAYGRFNPLDDVWHGEDGRLYDPFRPTVQPGGFPTRREYDLDRKRHLAATREMFETADVFIFTLGLTECWKAKADGAVYPLCPGVAAGHFDSDQHIFENLSVQDVIEDLNMFLTEVRSVNPGIRLILTVSPVPLAATAEPRHVWTSTTLSKAVLRVAAEEVARQPGVIYFPSYEVISLPSNRGSYFEDDLRSVSSAGVDHVMRLFFRHMVEHVTDAPFAETTPNGDAFLEQARCAVEILCDEARLDPTM